MNRQEYFDLIVTTTEAGGFPCYEVQPDFKAGRYLSSDGRKCVIGLVIPQEKYNKDLEGHSVYTLIDEIGSNILDLDDTEELMSSDCPESDVVEELQELQDTHDEHLDCWNDQEFLRRVIGASYFRNVDKSKAYALLDRLAENE